MRFDMKRGYRGRLGRDPGRIMRNISHHAADGHCASRSRRGGMLRLRGVGLTQRAIACRSLGRHCPRHDRWTGQHAGEHQHRDQRVEHGGLHNFNIGHKSAVNNTRSGVRSRYFFRQPGE